MAGSMGGIGFTVARVGGRPDRTAGRGRPRLRGILCNSEGGIVSYFKWIQDIQRLFWEYDEIKHQTNQILDRAFSQVTECVSHRMAAMAIVVEKERDDKRERGLFP